ncbi:hypothetical protein B0H34DRAFT_858548, partial [Crassisporium funariophilum]
MMLLMPATVKGTHIFCLSQGISGMDPFQDDHNSLLPSIFGNQEDLAVEEEETTQPDGASSILYLFHPLHHEPSKDANMRDWRHLLALSRNQNCQLQMLWLPLHTAIIRFGDSMCKSLFRTDHFPGPVRILGAVHITVTLHNLSTCLPLPPSVVALQRRQLHALSIQLFAWHKFLVHLSLIRL